MPRKADSFQKDIFPDAFAGVPSMSAAEWLHGGNTAAITRSMKPGSDAAVAARPALVCYFEECCMLL